MACICYLKRGVLRVAKKTHETVADTKQPMAFCPCLVSLSAGDWHVPLVAPTHLKATSINPLKGKTEIPELDETKGLATTSNHHFRDGCKLLRVN